MTRRNPDARTRARQRAAAGDPAAKLAHAVSLWRSGQVVPPDDAWPDFDQVAPRRPAPGVYSFRWSFHDFDLILVATGRQGGLWVKEGHGHVGPWIVSLPPHPWLGDIALHPAVQAKLAELATAAPDWRRVNPRRRNPDDQRRERARRARAEGGIAAEVARLTDGMRSGQIPSEDVNRAALLGDEAARQALPRRLSPEGIQPEGWTSPWVLDDVVGSLYPYGSATADEMFRRSAARVDTAREGTAWPLESRHHHDNAVEAMARSHYREALDAMRNAAGSAAAPFRGSSGERTEAWAREMDHQYDDLIALLLQRPLPEQPVTRRTNPHPASDENLRDLERRARGGDGAAARALHVARARAGVDVTPAEGHLAFWLDGPTETGHVVRYLPRGREGPFVFVDGEGRMQGIIDFGMHEVSASAMGGWFQVENVHDGFRFWTPHASLIPLGPEKRTNPRVHPTPDPSGYRDCACRDCFDTAIGPPGAMCHACEAAGCEPWTGRARRGTRYECQRTDAYGVDDGERTNPRRRRNPDERMRDLERRAAQGDPQAQAELSALRARTGMSEPYTPWRLAYEHHGGYWVKHERTGKLSAQSLRRNRGTAWDVAEAEAWRLNRSLSDAEVLWAFVRRRPATGRNLVSTPEGRLLTLGFGGTVVAHWEGNALVEDGPHTALQQRVLRAMRRALRASDPNRRRRSRREQRDPTGQPLYCLRCRTRLPIAGGDCTNCRENPLLAIVGNPQHGPPPSVRVPSGATVRTTTTISHTKRPPAPPKRARRRGRVKRNPLFGPRRTDEAIELNRSIEAMPHYDEAVDRYERFHGTAPTHARRIVTGKGKVTERRIVAALGEVPETVYTVTHRSQKYTGDDFGQWEKKWKKGKPPRGRPVTWVHPHDEGAFPIEVIDPATGVTSKLPTSPKTVVDDYWHH